MRYNGSSLHSHLDHMWLEDLLNDHVMCLNSLWNQTLYYVLYGT